MRDPEVLGGQEAAVKDLDGADHDVQKASEPSDASQLPASKSSAPESAADPDHQRRSGRTRTVRVRDGFFDSSLLHYVSLDDPAAPRDGFPSRRSSPKAARHPQSHHHIEEGDDEDWDGMHVGPEHQATNIPACKPRPAQPTASEARFLQAQPLYPPVEPEEVEACETSRKTRAGLAGVTVPMPPIGVAASSSDFRYKWRWCKDNEAHCTLLSAAINALDKQLGPDMVKKLSLGDMGFKLREKWRPQEELLFALGMCDKYRMFKYIRQCYLCRRTVHELNGYYHNVWKTRSTRKADVFLTMREEGATRAEFSAYVDHLCNELVATWDRKTLGDMPKIVKDLAAAAAAEKAGGSRQQHQQQPQQQQQPVKRGRGRPRKDSQPPPELQYANRSDSDYEDTGATSDSSMSSDDSEVRAARRRSKQQRKRSYVAVSGDAGVRAGKRYASSGQAAWEQHYRRLGDHLPTPSGFGAQHWLHPGQLGVQRPRTDMPRAAASQPGICTHAPLQLPEMPRAPRQPSTTQAVVDWVKALPVFRHSLASHLESVDFITELAIDECQRYIQQLQKQRQAREEEARQYLDQVTQQGRQVLVRLEAEEQEWKQRQLGQPPRPQPQEQQQQQQPWRQQADVLLAGAPGQSAAPSASSQHAEQPPLQWPPDVEMSDAPAHRREGWSAGLVQEGAAADRSAMGPPAPRVAWERPAPDSQKQPPAVQQPPDTAAGMDNDAAALPFPGGPTLAAWGLGQWTGKPAAGPPAVHPPSGTYARPPVLPPYPAAHAAAAAGHPSALHAGMVHKPIPRPYMRH